MRLAAVATLLVALVADSAPGASILYATAATPGRVDAFCIGPGGVLAPEPAFSIFVGANPDRAQPSRLVVAGNVLYVGQADRVEAFAIGARGGLRRIGSTRPVQGSRPLDMIAANGMLYVAEAGSSRVAAHPLDAEGAPANELASCIMGLSTLAYQRLALQNGLLYVSAAGLPGRVEVHPVAADGSLPASGEAACTLPTDRRPPSGTRPDATTPLSHRGSLDNPKAMVVNGDFVYVEERGSQIIRAFQLTSGLFAPPVQVTRKKKRFQKPLATSAKGPIYQVMVLHEDSLLLTAFGRGRIDSFKLRSNGKIRKQPSSTTEEDVRMSPLGLVAPSGKRILYVASGEHDRVVAYRLNGKGVIAERTPFSETKEQEGSFPNDVAIAVLPGGCG
jgi:6-phosphogluconolactonase (cycloisomerase 2 family)